jgi:DNA-binding CsgD family transcriptional regulator
MKIAPQISLTEEERTMLTLWSRLIAHARLALRAKILLLAADGKPNMEIARQLQASTKTVSMWRRRFQKGRLAGIEKAAPRGKPQSEIDGPIAHLIIQKTLHGRPDNAAHWTTRSLAKELGVSPSLIQRIWKANGLTPSRRQ